MYKRPFCKYFVQMMKNKNCYKSCQSIGMRNRVFGLLFCSWIFEWILCSKFEIRFSPFRNRRKNGELNFAANSTISFFALCICVTLFLIRWNVIHRIVSMSVWVHVAHKSSYFRKRHTTKNKFLVDFATKFHLKFNVLHSLFVDFEL